MSLPVVNTQSSADSRKAAADPLQAELPSPADKPTLALVIPTLREAANLPALLDRVRAALDTTGVSYEILIVDDDSRDGTEELVTAIHAQDPRVRLLVRRGERGLSGAVLYGWRRTEAEILGVMDADLQHPPEMLPQLVAAMLEGKDIVIGSRYTQGGQLGEWNWMRRFLSTPAVRLTWPLQHKGCRANDPMAGFFMVRAKCVEGVPFQPTGFKLLLEVLVRGRIHSLAEVPIVFGLREQGASKANFKVGWHYLQLLIRLYALRIFSSER